MTTPVSIWCTRIYTFPSFRAFGKEFLKDRLKMQVGVAPSVLMMATQYNPMLSYDGNQFTSGASQDKSGGGFTNLLVNGLFETNFSISKNIALNMNYQRSFKSIYDEDNRPGGKAFFNSISFGVSYITP